MATDAFSQPDTATRPDAIMVVPDPVMRRREATTLEFLASHGLLAIFEFGESARRGALVSYGPNLADLAPRAAEYVDRILKGANPGDLPIEGPTRYYLVVNLKTARPCRAGANLDSAARRRGGRMSDENLRDHTKAAAFRALRVGNLPAETQCAARQGFSRL
jgi:ABC-type uncharacterized transport system substrate-binding protein